MIGFRQLLRRCGIMEHMRLGLIFPGYILTAMLHESGHLHTGALHKVNSPFQLVEQNEYRADADAFRRCLPPDEIRTAMRAGYTEPWQLAEYFDLDEDYIKKALHYWTQCRGVDFNQ